MLRDNQRTAQPPGDDLPALAPVEPLPRNAAEAAEARRALLRALAQRSAAKEPFQCSLAELAAVFTFLAVVMTLAHYLPLPVFAGLTGAGTVLGMHFLHLVPRRARWLAWAWAALAATYLVAAAAAIVSR